MNSIYLFFLLLTDEARGSVFIAIVSLRDNEKLLLEVSKLVFNSSLKKNKTNEYQSKQRERHKHTHAYTSITVHNTQLHEAFSY